MALRGKIKRQVARLERAGNNDFVLILTGGAEAFATHELHQLLRRIKVQGRKLRRLREAMFKIGLLIPFLMFAACAAALINMRHLTGVLLCAIPFCVFILGLAQFHISRHLSCLDRGKRLRCIIQQELDRRRRGQHITY